ncbi:T9SS type A sorting domain-containing protein [Bacteroidota bacterium]
MKKMRAILMTIVMTIIMTISGFGQNKYDTTMYNIGDTLAIGNLKYPNGSASNFNFLISYVNRIKKDSTYIQLTTSGILSSVGNKFYINGIEVISSNNSFYIKEDRIHSIKNTYTYGFDTLVCELTLDLRYDTTTSGVGFQNIELDDIKEKVYPNPVVDYLSVKTDTNKDELIRLYDANGRLVKETYETKLDFTTYSKGLYFVELLSADGKITILKVLKE